MKKLINIRNGKDLKYTLTPHYDTWRSLNNYPPNVIISFEKFLDVITISLQWDGWKSPELSTKLSNTSNVTVVMTQE